MWRHVAANALTLFVVGLFLGGGLVAWGAREYRTAGPLDEAICLSVPAGTNLRAVSADLGGQGAISSPAIFRIGAEYAGKAALLKEGSYLIPEGASMAEIVDAVTRGGTSTCGTEVVYRIGVTSAAAEVRALDPATARFDEVASFDPATEGPPAAYDEARAQVDATYRVVVAEGVTSWQVVQALAAFDVLEGEAGAVPAEGTLAPGSYDVVPGGTVAALLDRMEADQARILTEAWASRAEGLPLASPEEALVLASIVEKETGLREERAQVASVFVNRLEQGMRLQTDPTVIYGITRGEGVLGRGLRQSELDGRTPWNTYVIDGLPPTPIANPGAAAIQAALNPDPTDFLYFVADGTGGHAFGTTLDEHNANVARWREIEARAAAEAAGGEAATAVP